jgi:nitrite reductase/ring-hydroxylating ferredoxin subunit
MADFVKVAGTAEVTPGTGVAAEVNGQAIAVFNVGGTYCAIDNTCIHRGGPLGEGELEGDTVTCPWHGWQYNVKTGACINNPSATLKSYEVKVEGTDVKVLL